MADIRSKYDDCSIDEIVQVCIDRGIIVEPDLLDNRDALLDILHHDVEDFYTRERSAEKFILRTGMPAKHNEEGISDVEAKGVPDKLAQLAENYNADHERISKEREHKVRPIKVYDKPARKRGYADFVKMFNKRYNALANILKTRKELANVTSISRLIGKKERENVALIGMVYEKQESKSKHIILKLEDPTGQIEVWLANNKRELQEIGRDIVLDEVIGIVGQTAGNRIFASSIIFPDVPLSKELKKGPHEKYAVFVGDVHVGSKLFLKDEFEKFLMWLSGNFGNAEQRAIAKKVEYAIFTGDLVEGVGIYPQQDLDLNIIDIKEQYNAFARYIKMIPEHIQVVLIAGNHDAGRLQEPQLPIYKDFAEEVYALPNVTMLSNPSLFTIDQTVTHPGFDILLYHGYSLIYYANNIQSIRDAGGQKVTERIMKLLLQKRHLSPTHGCNTYVPDPDEDPMLIDRVPDFFITGHVHRVSYANYRGVTVMNASCWSEVSEEQEKRGLEPQPARLPIVNLRTRELRIMNFYHGSEAKKAKIQAEAAEQEVKT
jgi:DNA polymerase II small subunit